MIDYHKELGSRYTHFCIDQAVRAAKASAKQHQPSYYTGDDFEPHLWVVEAIAFAFRLGRIE